MAKNRYIPRSKHDSGKHLALQELLMRKHFPCFKCSLRKGTLVCVGEITPCAECSTYKVRISLDRGMTPKVRVIEPDIEPSRKIHMYSSGHLCLFKPEDQPWMDTDCLHEKIVPWTAEWLVYYELYLITGEWLGPEASHGEEPKVQQKKAS